MKVAYFSPMPPERSGIADYDALLVPALERRLDIEVVDRGDVDGGRHADVCVYHVGNSPEAHEWIIEALRRRPGVVVLHEFVLHHLVAGLTIGRNDGAGYLRAMQREAGVAGRLLAHGVIDGLLPPLWEIRPEDFPLAGEVLELAAPAGLIVHSRYVAENALKSGYEGRLWRIPHPAWPPPTVAPAAIDGSPVIGSFGNVNASKRVPQLLEAFGRFRRRHPGATLLLVGASSPHFDLEARVRGLPLAGVRRAGYVDEDRLWALMSACDAVAVLRAPTMGETSGSAVRALSLGKPLVVSDVGWFSELPHDVALKVPVDAHESETLARALELAATEPSLAAMSAASASYAVHEHGLDRIADMYAAAIEEAAGGSVVQDTVLAEVAAAAADVGIGPGDPMAAELAERLSELELVG